MNTNNKMPGVYVERLPLENSPSQGTGWGIASFVGTAVSGSTSEAVYVESFSQFSEEFGKVDDAPYMADGHLAYAVYDFFKCGGSACFIARVKPSGMATATGNIGGTELVISAKDGGAWANGIVVTVSTNEDDENLFDIEVKKGDTVLSTYTALSNSTTSTVYFADVMVDDRYITITSGSLVAGSVTLANGADGLDSVTDDDYVSALDMLAEEDITWVAVPGETSTKVVDAIVKFVEETRKGKTFAVIDTPIAATETTLKTFAKSHPTDMGACFAPWGIVTDQLTGAKRKVPPCGAVLGNFASTVSGRGIAKAPAGIGCTCDSWIGVSRVISDKECGILNSANVNCIVPQTGYGICIWGARVLKENTKQNRKYINHTHLDLYMDKSLKELTLFTVFETINTRLMERTVPIVKAFMTELFQAGCFVGETPEEAFTVTCDWTNNTAGGETFNIDIGYAKSKPNEFTLIRIKQRKATA